MNSLEEKLKPVIDDLLSRIKERELSLYDCCTILFNGLSSQGIVTGEYSEHREDVARLFGALEGKLHIREIFGLRRDYFVHKSTHISIEAQEDIQRYNRLVESTKTHVRKTVGKKSLYEDEFSKMIREHVATQTPDLDDSRRIYVVGYIIGSLEREFNVQKRPDYVGKYTIGMIKDAIGA